MAEPPLGRVRRRLVLAFDALQDSRAALALIAKAPPAFVQELVWGVDISPALRHDRGCRVRAA